MSDFCILCAAPRSGTTLLGEAVADAYDAGYPEEIFFEIFVKPALECR